MLPLPRKYETSISISLHFIALPVIRQPSVESDFLPLLPQTPSFILSFFMEMQRPARLRESQRFPSSASLRSGPIIRPSSPKPPPLFKY